MDQPDLSIPVPFAYFQRHHSSKIWQEVIAAAAGLPGVVAAYDQPLPLPCEGNFHDRVFPVYAEVCHALGIPVEEGGDETGTAAASEVESVPALSISDPLADLHSDCEKIDAAVSTGNALLDDSAREAFKEYVDRWSRVVFGHEPQVLDPAVQHAEPIERQDGVAIEGSTVEEMNAALLAAGLVLVHHEHGLVVEKISGHDVESPAQEDEPTLGLAREELTHVGYSYTKTDGHKYLVRDRREGEKVAEMVEGFLYEGKPVEGLPPVRID